jgi:lysophospholipase L1-like esterase
MDTCQRPHEQHQRPTRRLCLCRTTLMALMVIHAAPAVEPLDGFLAVLPPNPVVLFQGDSITDGNRGRNQDPNHILGHGYQFIIAADIGAREPERNVHFLNRGISGNEVSDLVKRWQDDVIALKPDLLSVLIGINDFTHVADGRQAGTPAEYERAYDALLTATKEALPGIRFVLGEPFLLPVGKREVDYQRLLSGLQLYQQAVERLATKYHAPMVRYQRLFDAACARAPAAYWVWDGVHPTYSGHGLMATEWLKTVNIFYHPTPP